MNEILFALGIETWKPILASLLLPPVPLLVLVLLGTWMVMRRRLLGGFVVLLAVVGLWLSCTEGAGQFLSRALLQPQHALSEPEIAALKKAPRTAIVVLGGGRNLLSPEYGLSSLKPRTMERLRYAMWLARETALPVAFSGGVGHESTPGPSEAEIAGRIAEREFGRGLRWLEGESRDTHENAYKTVALLQPQGIEQIVLVTHGYHMRRALKNFHSAADGRNIKIVAAPMGLAPIAHGQIGDWLPSTDGFEDTWIALHEWLGRLAGA
jgi:uncharacterized SAM-binding protein YcdF (DUF218 family)